MCPVRRSRLSYDVWVNLTVPDGSTDLYVATLTRYAGGEWRKSLNERYELPLPIEALRELCDSVDELIQGLVAANLGVALELRAEQAPPVAADDPTTR